MIANCHFQIARIRNKSDLHYLQYAILICRLLYCAIIFIRFIPSIIDFLNFKTRLLLKKGPSQLTLGLCFALALAKDSFQNYQALFNFVLLFHCHFNVFYCFNLLAIFLFFYLSFYHFHLHLHHMLVGESKHLL